MRLLSVKEVAKLLDMHEVTIRDKCRSEELPCFKIGRHWKIKEADLNKWIEEQKE